MTISISKLARRTASLVAVALLIAAMGGTWKSAAASPISQALAPPAAASPEVKKSQRRDLTGKLNLNTATEEQLMMLPTIGPAKAERIVIWRKKNGGFRRIADLRRVKGIGYKSFKRLEPFLDVKGVTTLVAR